jgi:uncharacterized protein YcaQ
MPAQRTVTLEDVRRMAIAKQRLAGPRRTPTDARAVLDVIRDLRCLQLDPISVLARSPLLVLWSRLGPFDRGLLDRLLWRDRSLFEYWAHRASIVLTEDYQIHQLLMRRYPTDRSSYSRRIKEWLRQNQSLRRHVMARLRSRGPQRLSDFEDRSTTGWESGGWTTGRNVERMLDVLWTQGRVMVSRREGLTKWWDLAERCLPEWTQRKALTELQVVTRAAQLSLRALGIARQRDIERHFTIGRYKGLRDVLAMLRAKRTIEEVRVSQDGADLRGPWFVHSDDLALLDAVRESWEPRTTMLSPFDNLIIDRDRTALLFGFDYRMEIYVPKDIRRYGYYVLPILAGDRFIGRLDAAVDRRAGRLIVHAIHAEPDVRTNRRDGEGIAQALGELAEFVETTSIAYPREVPTGWRRALS